jgi:hypothetical protein
MESRKAAMFDTFVDYLLQSLNAMDATTKAISNDPLLSFLGECSFEQVPKLRQGIALSGIQQSSLINSDIFSDLLQ